MNTRGILLKFLANSNENMQAALKKFNTLSINEKKIPLHSYFVVMYQRYERLCAAGMAFSNTKTLHDVMLKNFICEIENQTSHKLFSVYQHNDLRPNINVSLPIIKILEEKIISSKNSILIALVYLLLEKCTDTLHESMYKAFDEITGQVNRKFLYGSFIHELNRTGTLLHKAIADELDLIEFNESEWEMVCKIATDWFYTFLIECFTIDKNLQL